MQVHDDRSRSSSPRLPLQVVAAGRTHRGRRPTNDDLISINPRLGLFALFDGMGGAPYGGLAAQVASDALVEAFLRYCPSHFGTPVRLMTLALDHAAAAVYRTGQSKPDYRGMGTTAVAFFFVQPDRAVIGHAGDSRAYHLRGNQLTLLTQDHTSQRPQDLALSKVLGWRTSGVLDRNLGAEQGVKAEVTELELEPGDRILLSSDGLHGCVAEDRVRESLGSGDAGDAAHQLVEDALHDERSRDNISALVMTITEAAGGIIE